MRILITEDDRAIRRAIRDVLEMEGHLVDEAEHGEEALAKFEQTSYDVLFCDIKMPRMDGLELMEALREQGHQPEIIVMSGHGNIEMAVKALRLGAYDFIEKPLNLNRILVAINHLKEKGQLIQSNVALKSSIKKFKGNGIIGNSVQILEIQRMIQKVLVSTWVRSRDSACRAPVRSLNHWKKVTANDEQFALAA